MKHSISILILVVAAAAQPQAPAEDVLRGEVMTLPEEISSQTKALNPHFLLYTQKQQPEGQESPLIIVLHGGGGGGNGIPVIRFNNVARMVNENKHPFAVLIPQRLKETKEPLPDGWRPEDLDLLLQYVIENYPIDTRRIYLTGSSMGGAGTWRFANLSPQRFAAIAPLAGGGRTREEGIVDLPLDGLEKTPIWVFQGRLDEVTPIEYTEEIVAKLKARGANVKLTVYDDRGHNTKAHGNTELYEWFLTHSLSAKPTDN